MDVEKLLAPRADTASGLPEADVEVADMGTVRVRGLSRDEVFGVQQLPTLGSQERRILALGMVDPPMTEAQAGQWQLVSPAGELEPVTDAIRELSGIAEDSAKTAYLNFRGRPDPRVRAPAGTGPRHDGGHDAPGDE